MENIKDSLRSIIADERNNNVAGRGNDNGPMPQYVAVLGAAVFAVLLIFATVAIGRDSSPPLIIVVPPVSAGAHTVSPVVVQ
ncbi:MAG: hypothetical protein LDL44_04560 [Caenispirillum sp.]|nr:hypothetical protein [Caenispirillum sp.]